MKSNIRLVLLAAVAIGLAGPAAAQSLTLKRVMLSQGGVGYFEYEAAVTGDARLSLELRRDQIDDVLKSIVVYDDRGGIGGVHLAGEDPVEQAFRDLPFGPDALQSPAALLNALQGAEIAITRPRTLRGRVVRVLPERVALPGNGGTIERHRVTVMTAEGLQQFVLEEADAVSFADPRLAAEVGEALDAVAANRGGERRTLTVDSRGSGTRTLRVGYVVAAPLWKASYRLTLGADPAAAKGRLQGWAVIENRSGQAWDGVELTLVSGSPVTFRQALWRAYYVERPEVPVEVVGRVLPRLDEGAVAAAMRADEGEQRGRAEEASKSRALAGPAQAMMRPAPAAAPPPPPPPPEAAPGAVAIEAGEAMTQVSFRFGQPVGVPAGESFVVPIIDGDQPAERLALYQPDAHPRHPLAAVRLKNEAGSGLPPGVLTLYERGAAGDVTYVGDARMGPLAAGEQRLLSFALDTKTIVDRSVEGRESVTHGGFAGGLFRYVRLDRQTATYRLAAPQREPRTLLIEHPRIPGYRLAAPEEKETELTPSAWRLKVALAAGESRSVTVTTERPRGETLRLADLSLQQLAAFAAGTELSAQVRSAFTEMMGLKRAIDERRQAVERLKREREGIVQDQSRLRDNLGRVPQGGDLYKRYLDRLAAQETRLEQIQGAADAAESALDRAAAALSDYIAKLVL